MTIEDVGKPARLAVDLMLPSGETRDGRAADAAASYPCLPVPLWDRMAHSFFH